VPPDAARTPSSPAPGYDVGSSPTDSGAIQVRQTTQQRVLDMSAELFNRYGIEAVSVGQLSQALNISPGNLTYHYKKKADIIAEHINRFEQQLQKGVAQIPDYSDAKTFCEAYIELLRLTLRYRFLFIGANYIIQNDLVGAARYERLIETTKRNFVRQFKRLIAEGYMREIHAPYSIDMLVDAIWWQWLGWLLVMQITPPSQLMPESRLLADAVLHIFFLSHHYVDQDFFQKVQTELKRLSRRPARVAPPAQPPARRTRKAAE
jgi:AcrR family transcriptional regulator